jgi:acyl-CoA reductase-like NAD-dependent aldehyde dehydrogenase
MSFPWSPKNLCKQNFINNEYVDSKSSKKLTVHNPKDGSLVADDVPLSGEEDVDAAVAAAEKAWPAWKKMGANERRGILNKFADLVEANGTAIAELTRITLGAPYKAFGAFEVGLCAEVRVNSLEIHTECMKLPNVAVNKADIQCRLSGTTLGGLISSAVSPGLRRMASSKSCAMSPSV